MVFIATPVGILGFTICAALVLICVPIGLFTTIQTLWSWSAIGQTRKTLTTCLILLLWWTLPLLAVFLLAWSWAVVGILLETAIWVLPPTFIFFGCYWGLRGAAEVRRLEREKQPTTDDITLSELVYVLLVTVSSCIITGTILFWLTLLKSPFLFIGVMFHGSCIAIKQIFSLSNRVEAWALLLLIIAFAVGFFVAMPCVGLAIAVSWLLEVTIATLWPPFVAHYGWQGKQRHEWIRIESLLDAVKAAYQVVWVADLLTNAAMFGKVEMAVQVAGECREIAKGQRRALSNECQHVTLLPPIFAY